MQWLLQNFDQRQFVQDYWQQKPCLIKNAFIELKSPVTPEELAGLACEEQIHSRLVQEKGGATPWQLRYGPFDESDFTNLPESHYSLLVSECEKWIPEIAELQRLFYFIPQWRHDDVMISYAPSGGSVGPHVDEYDVFLIQFEGQRRWQYGDRRLEYPELIPDIELAILESFQPDYDEVLLPGDMLYLPPGVAHHGVAVDRCMTCSIGFRVPTALESLESFAQEIDKNSLGNQRYSDVLLQLDRHSAEITAREIERFRKLTAELLDQPAGIWIDAIGKLLTDTVTPDEIDREPVTDISELLRNNWVKDVDSRFLYYCDDAQIRFYGNSQLILLRNSPDNLKCVQVLCDGFQIDVEFIQRYAQNHELIDLLKALVNNGSVVPLV